MKKPLSLLMVLMTMLIAVLCLSFSSFAVDSDSSSSIVSTSVTTNYLKAAKTVKSISFKPKSDYVLYERVDQYERLGGGYLFNEPEFKEGDRFTVVYSDSKSVTYQYKLNYKFDTESSDYVPYFVSADGQELDPDSVDYNDNQDNRPWTVNGKYNYFTLTYEGKTCKIPVTIRKNPVKAIRFEPYRAYTVYEKLNQREDYYGNIIYDIERFKNGDKLKVAYTDAKSVVYTYSTSVRCFVAPDGRMIDYWDVDYYDDQTSSPWKVNGDKNYFILTYCEKSFKVPVTVAKNPVKSISASYQYDMYKSSKDTFKKLNSDFVEDYIIYKLTFNSGKTYSGTEDQLESKYNIKLEYSMNVKNMGKNTGTCSLYNCDGENLIVKGTFTLNVKEMTNKIPKFSISKTRSFVKGEKINFQFIKFSDAGYKHHVRVFEVPEGLKLNNNGYLTGVVKYGGNLSFDIQWDNVDYNCKRSYDIDTYYQHTLPEKATTIEYNKTYSVTASDKNPKWFKFRSLDSWIDISSYKVEEERTPYGFNCLGMNFCDSKGREIECENCGDGLYGPSMIFENLVRGDYYYLKVTSSGTIRFDCNAWMPSINSNSDREDLKIKDATIDLTKKNVKKTFSGDTNTLWNIYTIKDRLVMNSDKKDPLYYAASMLDFASPVDLHMTTQSKSNFDVIGVIHYKYDPNNEFECALINASKTQSTLKKELRKGEKEYRFDNVYYLMPQAGTLTIQETSQIYVPSCYKFDSNHVHIVKRSGHTSTAKVTKATLTQNGKVDYYCNACKANVRTVSLPKVSTVKLSATKYTYTGKEIHPKVIVKNSKGKTLTLNKDYTVSYSSGCKAPGVYTVTVVLKGNYNGTKKLSFSIVPKAPTLSAVAGEKKAVLSWDKQSCATGYVVYMSTSKNGKYSKVATLKGNSSVKYTKSGLTTGTGYFFKVAAYTTVNGKTTVYSDWSSVRGIRAK